MGNFFSPLVWASPLSRRLSGGVLLRLTGGAYFRAAFLNHAILPPLPSFTHPLPAVLVKPGNSLLNYRGRGEGRGEGGGEL